MATNAALDIKRGKEALVIFHNASLGYPGYNYDLNELYAKISEDSPSFLSGFGSAILVGHVSDSQLESAMTRAANEGKGRLPKRWADLFQYLMDEKSHISWGEVIVDSAKDAGKMVVSYGTDVKDALLNTGMLLKYVPFVAFAGLAYYVFLQTKGARKIL